jgi:bifunctional N-acetylglucosamine-1-phosphate-uridyltransferase/glucosamine-1-phosphate-acetyltransferase GlmU-like protein
VKIKKLIRKAESYLDSDERDRKEKKKYLKQVLRKLSDHEKKLQARLVDETDQDERAGLEKKLALVHAQRKKGLRLQKALMDQSKE